MPLPDAGDFIPMKNQALIMRVQLVSVLLTVVLLAGAAAAATTTGGQIAVKGITRDPDVFMPWDSGTIRIQIENTGTEPVNVGSADMTSNTLQVINYQTYDKVGTLGAGDTLEFTFLLKANGLEGLFFPELYLDLGDAGSMRYPIPVRVDATGILVSVMDVPDSFVQGEGNPVVLSVSNPRKNNVTGVTVVPRGEGIQSTQTSVFVGTLQPDGMKNVTFEITPSQSTDLTFEVSYSNGMNRHTANITLPISIGERSMTASPVVNNVEVSQGGATYTLKGDVTNAGLSDAKSVVATVGSPAQPVDPNKVYVIGALEPDDFSSFELSFTAQGATSVPLVILYKDEDGKSYETRVDISLRTAAAGSTGSAQAQAPSFQGRVGRTGSPGMMGFGSGLRNFPLTEILLAIAGVIALAVAWKKVIGPRIRARKRQKAQK
jgi:hypothetical protein